MVNWKDKKVLVCGDKGMIGQELVRQLIDLGIDFSTADIKDGFDLRDYRVCNAICSNIDIVFYLVGIKGSPKMTKERPVDFMEPMLKCDTNMITAAQSNGVKRFLYTSSIAVENPESDRFPAWAKKTGETLIEAMRIQYPIKYAMSRHLDDPDYKPNDWIGTKWCIVRPANVYGRFDNFDNTYTRYTVLNQVAKYNIPFHPL